jgi:malate/lactate dehydrogenase
MMGMMKMVMAEVTAAILKMVINAVGNPVHVLSNVAMKLLILEKIEMMVI